MRGLTRRWLLPADHEAAPAGHGTTNPAVMQRVLRARGLVEPDLIRRFCEPKLTDLHEPSLLPGIQRAADRLVAALRAGESIVIYGDYDVDGISATAILYHILKAAQPQASVQTYVPHRIDEGYGLNADALRQLRAGGASVVVSVDCGITAAEPARLAKSIGLDLIITDHHNLPENGVAPEDAFAVVHPRAALPQDQQVKPYPFGDLCGAGVAFKLAWQIAATWCSSQRVSEHLQRTLLDLLPLAALGTIADVVPLIDENRVIACYGLRLIKRTPIDGLKALIEAAGLMDESIDCEKVGFVLGPRLNACGRMGHAAEAVQLLTTARGDEAAAIARRLTGLNRQRQETERSIFEHACHKADDAGMTRDDRRIIVLADEGWHPGVVGIVCSRLAERYGRPAILLQRQGEVCRGSARSIIGYSIHGGLLSAAEHLETFGGHDVAAGLTLRTANLPRFVDAITEHANRCISVEQLTPALSIDCDAAMNELDLDSVKRLSALSPFGRENPRPTLRLQGLTLTQPPRQMGGYGSHLSLNLRADDRAETRWLRGVWWNRGSLAADLAAGMRLDVVIEPKINEWNGRVSVEGEIKDVRVLEPVPR